jgi:glycine cleavage system H protein
MADFDYPADLRYTAEHEWVLLEGDVAKVGITAYAQDALGDIVYVTLPDSGAVLEAGQACGEIESPKSVSDIYAPLNGTVVERNEALDSNPELVNQDPYGQGWMLRIRLADPAQVGGLLSAESYAEQLG